MSEELQDILNELTYKGWEEETKKIKEEIDSIDNMKTQLLLSASNYKKDKEIERLNKIIEIKNNRIQQLMKRTRSARINKAIEYIQDRYDGETLTHTFDKDNVKELLEILSGDKND